MKPGNNFPSSTKKRGALNEAYIGDTGWFGVPTVDNVGYDRGKVKTYDEALVVALTHEAIHANHYARLQEAVGIGGERRPDLSAQYLLDNGYSEEFVNMFHKKDGYGEWIYEDDVNVTEAKMENYIRNNNHSVLDAALNEYRREH